MADISTSPSGGDASGHSAPEFSATSSANPLTTATNVAGALVSVALVIGVAIWGYKLLVRDVSGIPVVQAVSGEMRIRPEDPGGQLAQHQGLSVNAVAAQGVAEKPADALRLAPRPVDLTQEDIVQPAALVAQTQHEQQTADTPGTASTPDVAAALQSGNVDALVAQLTEGVEPLSDLSADVDEVVAQVTQSVVAEVKAAEVQVAAIVDAPGVRASLRPRKRPATRPVVTEVAAALPAGGVEDVDPGSLPAGTRLAQLGAFDSAEVAREQWVEMQSRFAVYLDGKKRVIQKAKSGGRVFYRLRAYGFEDITDARRFCSALVAENADCIPVVTR